MTTELETVGAILFYWTAAFSIIEPLTSLLFFARRRELKTSNTGLAVLCDFFYRSHIILYPMFIWKYILNRGYVPAKDDYKGLCEFIAIYCAFLIALDIIWDNVIRSIPYLRKIRYMDIFERYTMSTKPIAVAGDVAHGASWITLTWWMYHNLDAISACSILFGGLFLLTLISA